MKIHQAKSPLAGRTLRIKATARHHLYTNFAGAEFVVTDWADRIYGQSVYAWTYPPMEVLVYIARWSRYLAGHVPVGQEDELLVGTIMGNKAIAHISEVEELTEPDPLTPFPMAA